MSHNFIIANGDTDSISFKKPDEKPFTPEEQEALLEELNALMPKGIVWKNDKFYRRMIVLAAKNYVLDDGKKITFKGNSIKATKKEPALKAFIKEVIDLLLKDRKEQVIFLYLKKAMEISTLIGIDGWCFKATVTKKVLEPTTTFNQKIKDAIGNTPVSEGDKIYLFYREDGSLCLRENFAGNFDRVVLLRKLKDTMKVFRNILDVDLFPNLTLKRNEDLLTFMIKEIASHEAKISKDITQTKETIKPPTGIILVRKVQ